MQFELSKTEVQHIEKYRNLFPEFQKASDKQMGALLNLQTQILKNSLEDTRKEGHP